MRSRPPFPPRQRGAALLLLVAVLGMAGAALLMSAYRPAGDDLRHEQRTQRQLAAAREALLGYAAQYGRLPRPAASAIDGTESAQPCERADSCSGFIPWVTLGIEGTDSWGKLLRYSVTPAFTAAPILPLTPGDRQVLGRNRRGEYIELAGRRPCELYAQCPPAVIYSSGKNNLGTSSQGVAQAAGVGTDLDERSNDVAVSQFISRARSDDPRSAGGEFDDLVVWLPIQQVNARLRATRAH
ncbi:hypothetical protein E4L98_12915 [Duganella callida]|uniref:Type II secretion system protein n=2 Tax=Duganella callida TaxID=2561932 RepID=A0A4Y9SIQ5_9BURK|nr:hypothetical protein E4L98_12915 [Duganella callida]